MNEKLEMDNWDVWVVQFFFIVLSVGQLRQRFVFILVIVIGFFLFFVLGQGEKVEGL